MANFTFSIDDILFNNDSFLFNSATIRHRNLLDTLTIVYYIGVGKPMLELRSVYKHYSSIPAVEDVSFSARAGESRAILVRTAQASQQQ